MVWPTNSATLVLCKFPFSPGVQAQNCWHCKQAIGRAGRRDLEMGALLQRVSQELCLLHAADLASQPTFMCQFQASLEGALRKKLHMLFWPLSP